MSYENGRPGEKATLGTLFKDTGKVEGWVANLKRWVAKKRDGWLSRGIGD